MRVSGTDILPHGLWVLPASHSRSHFGSSHCGTKSVGAYDGICGEAQLQRLQRCSFKDAREVQATLLLLRQVPKRRLAAAQEVLHADAARGRRNRVAEVDLL